MDICPICAADIESEEKQQFCSNCGYPSDFPLCLGDIPEPVLAVLRQRTDWGKNLWQSYVELKNQQAENAQKIEQLQQQLQQYQQVAQQNQQLRQDVTSLQQQLQQYQQLAQQNQQLRQDVTSLTKTFTRLNIIKKQICTTLRRTSDISKQSLENIVDRGIDKRYIWQVDVYGIDEEKYCRAQLSLQIDWDEYDIQMSQGKVTVTIDEKWEDDTAIEVDEAIKLFNEFVKKYSLNTKVYYSYSPEVDREKAEQELGLFPTKPVQWKTTTKDEDSLKIPELPEFTVGVRLAYEDETDGD